MKRFLIFLGVLLLLIITPYTANCNEKIQINKGTETSQISYVNSLIHDNNLMILDSNNVDVSEKYLPIILNIFENKNIYDLNSYLADNSLSLARFKNNYIVPFASEAKHTHFEKYYSNSAKGNSNVVAAWKVLLEGTFFYDINSQKITSFNKPLMSLTYYNIQELKDTGLTNFSPIITNISTYASKVDNYSCRFSGNYTMKAICIAGYLTQEFNFGNHSISYIGK